MSNSIAPGSSADVNVKVTALTTNPNVPVTYKTVILKKNLVNGVNTLTQAMMSAQNTKYVIKYDYVLGEDITVPANCVLEFDGGSISASSSNDTITGNNTGIKAGLVKIFNTNIIFAGTWGNKYLSPQWFGAYADGVHDDASVIEHSLKVAQDIKVSKILLTGKYGVSTLHIVGNQNGSIYNENIYYTLDGENNAQLISLDANSDIICYGNETTSEYCHIKTHLNGFAIIANNNSKCVINGKIFAEEQWGTTGNIQTRLSNIFIRSFVGLGIDCGAMTECDFYNIRLEGNGGNSIGIRIHRSIMNFYSITIMYCNKAIVCDKSAECSFNFFGGYFGVCINYVCFSKQQYLGPMLFSGCHFAENNHGDIIHFIDDESEVYYEVSSGVSFVNCVFSRIPSGENDNYLLNIRIPGYFKLDNCNLYNNPGASNIIKAAAGVKVDIQGSPYEFLLEDINNLYTVNRISKFSKIFSITEANTENPNIHFNMTIPSGKWFINGFTTYEINGNICHKTFQLIFNGSIYWPIADTYFTGSDTSYSTSQLGIRLQGDTEVTLKTYGLTNMPKETYTFVLELNMVNISDILIP